MIKKRLSLSLVALIGSVFLFVIASFAWFTLSNINDLGDFLVNQQDISVEAVLWESDDDITYTESTGISFENQVPGDVKYFKLVITNNNDFEVYTQVSLYGMSETYTSINGDTSNYASGRLLADVILLNTSNNIDSVTIVDQTLSSLVGSTKLITHDSVAIASLGTAELYFSFTIPETIGNDYQNLRLDFTNLYIQSVG
ncbi:MAG: hypothetical protein JEZ05_03850 [Tenericutes bacterium]|nr:hypothetical protein [Mycoplasmatota bacterium]